MTGSENNPDKQSANPSQKGPHTADLAARIKKAQSDYSASRGDEQSSSRQNDMSALARGLRIGTEFVAAILVGTGLGYVIDQLAGTGPWAMLVLFMLGFAAGILNVTRVVAELNAGAASSDDDQGTR